MAQYSLSSDKVQRGSGQSAVAHVAYIAGQCLTDQRTGQEADYTRRDGVEYAAPEIVLPASERETQSAQIERQALWNMAEAAEKRKDANPARKVRVALPCELGPVERRLLTEEYAQWLAGRFGVAVDYAVHRPDKEGDQRNFHAHLVMTTRQIENGRLGEKSTLEWDGKRLKEAELPSAKAQLVEMREAWETIHNRRVKELYPEVEPVSAKSLRAQSAEALELAAEHRQEGREEQAREAELKAIELDRTPQQHVGWKATDVARRNPEAAQFLERVQQRQKAQREHATLRQIVASFRKELANIAEQMAERLKHGLESVEARFQKWQQQQERRAQEKAQALERQKQQERERSIGRDRGGFER